MKLHKLSPAKGSVKPATRVGRGQGSGKGGHSTRGINGAQSRSGHKNKRNHEGGQMPLQMRLPKRGFKNTHRRYKGANPGEYVTFNLFELDYHAEKHGLTALTPELMYELGLVKRDAVIKILGDGQLERPLKIVAHRFSASAKAAILEQGGTPCYSLKTSQLQGIAHAYNLAKLDMKAIARNFDHIEETDKVVVVAEGSLKMKFDLEVYEVSEAAKLQVEEQGGQVSILG